MSFGSTARAPWSPTGIALVTLLLSSVAGAVLHALNYSRLGWPQRWRLALFSNLITPLLIGLAAILGPWTGLRFTVAIFLAAYFYKTQAPLFERHRAGGGRKASLVLPVILLVAVLVGLGVILSTGHLPG